MTKDEAIKAMGEGKKLTHKNFTDNEWVTEISGNYEFEDGCRCIQIEFWRFRHGSNWDRNWSIFNDKGE